MRSEEAGGALDGHRGAGEGEEDEECEDGGERGEELPVVVDAGDVVARGQLLPPLEEDDEEAEEEQQRVVRPKEGGDADDEEADRRDEAAGALPEERVATRPPSRRPTGSSASALTKAPTKPTTASGCRLTAGLEAMAGMAAVAMAPRRREDWMRADGMTGRISPPAACALAAAAAAASAITLGSAPAPPADERSMVGISGTGSPMERPMPTA